MAETYRGWIFYDGECALCRAWAGRSYRILRRRGFRLVALQVPWVKARLDLKDGEPPEEMRLLLASGQNFGGADAIVQIAKAIRWARPLYTFAKLPGAMVCLRAIYRSLARSRNCTGQTCRLPGRCARHSLDHSITSGFYELP